MATFRKFGTKSSDENAVYLKLEDEKDCEFNQPGSEVAVIAYDSEGKFLCKLVVFEEDGGLCLTSDIPDDIGLKTNKYGELITR